MFEILHPDDPKAAEKALEQWSKENPSATVSVSVVADHIDHIRNVAGIDHIGIGSDFDGISSTPLDLTGVQDFPLLFAELLRRGYSEDDLKRIAGRNVLRVMRKVEETAARLRSDRRASEARIDDTAE
jgi:membrane dipeptidase